MFQAALEATTDVGGGNVMSALFHAQPDTVDGMLRTGEPEVVEFDFVTQFPGPAKQPDVSLAAQCAFQRKRFPSTQRVVHLPKQEPCGLNRASAGFERRKATGDFVRI